MGILRKSMIGLASFVLFTSLMSFGLGFAFWQVFGHPGPVESALDQADIYDGILANFVQSHQDNTTIGVPLTNGSVQTAVQKAFPKSVVEPAVNQAINGVYAWVQGKTATPTFSIDLSSAKANLADYVEQVATQQAATLPVCSNDQLFTELQQVQQNTLSITCRPAQLSSAAIGAYAKQQVLSSSFLNKPLTPESLGLTTNGQLKVPSQQSKSTQTIAAPTLYQRLIQDLYASAAVAIICIGIIVWQHRDWLRGLRRAGGILGAAGVVCIVEAEAAGHVHTWLSSSKFNISGQQVADVLQRSIIKMIGILATDFHRWLLDYGVILFIVGIGTWIGMFILDRKKDKKEGPTAPPVDIGSDLHKPATTV